MLVCLRKNPRKKMVRDMSNPTFSADNCLYRAIIASKTTAKSRDRMYKSQDRIQDRCKERCKEVA